MSLAKSTISSIQALLERGETRSFKASFLTSLGLCWDGKEQQCVASPLLVKLASALPSAEEAIFSVVTCDHECRNGWISLVGARLKECGGRSDVEQLTAAIDQLGAASSSIVNSLPTAALQPTGNQELETELIGGPADQAVAWPKLLRAIGATAVLIEGEEGQPVHELPPINEFDSLRNWCQNRILQLPHANSEQECLRFVLTGNYGPLSDSEAASDEPGHQALMRWVLLRPWATLLAQVVFMQEAWIAEQISGRMTLELPDDQLANAYQPQHIDIVVVAADGEELLCGTLAGLVIRVLNRLGVTLLARPNETSRLDELLAPVVHLLLQKHVWRFDPRGGGSGRPGYTIDDEFSTSCYRAFGSKHFYRGCSTLTDAIRISCEQWAQEKLRAARLGESSAALLDTSLAESIQP